MIEIIQRQGRTIFFSSHILGDVERVADRIGIMVDGALRVDCPTERFKSSLRRIVLQFDRPAPPCPAIAGVVASWQSGRKLEATIVGYEGAQQAAFEALEPQSVDVVEMNLEDAFIAYTRGPRRTLAFLGETEAAQSTKSS